MPTRETVKNQVEGEPRPRVPQKPEENSRKRGNDQGHQTLQSQLGRELRRGF